LIFLSIAIAVLLLTVSCSSNDQSSQAPKNSQANSSKTNSFANNLAPDFNLPLLTGRVVKLSDYRGKPLVLNFWASWCPACREEGPTLGKVSQAYEGKVQFLGVIVQDSKEKAEAFMKESNISYDNVIDNGTAVQLYKVTGIPQTFFIDRKGRIVGHWIGAITEDKLVQYIKQLLL
jgi:peroxiredoxin